jgi:hypothetical protein
MTEAVSRFILQAAAIAVAGLAVDPLRLPRRDGAAGVDFIRRFSRPG